MSVEELALKYLGGSASSETSLLPNPPKSTAPAAASGPTLSLDAIPAEIAALIAQKTASSSSAASNSLLQVVRASQEWLVSSDDGKRGRGIGLLALVIQKCPKEAITRQETRTLSEFLTTCLSSTPIGDAILVPAVQGLASLAALPHFTPGDTTAVCRALFKNVELVGRPQTTRYLVFSLIDSLMAHQRRALKKMGKEFISGYCTLVTGEKDPRNLRTAFSIANVVLVEFDITDSVEDLFDITFCYFPITFTPPPNDPYGITSEDLQASLRNCLSATPRFGPLALSLFLEKLQASTSSSKKQTLRALMACFPVYGKAVVESLADKLWEATSVEVFHANDDEVETLALEAIKVLLATLYPDTAQVNTIEAADDSEETAGAETAEVSDVGPDGKKASIAKKIWDACSAEFKESEKSNALAAVQILKSCLEASGPMARYIVPRAFNRILSIFRSSEQLKQRPSLFSHIASLLASLRSCPVAEPAAPFEEFREEVLSLSASSISSPTPELRQPALDCLVQLVQLPGSLTGDERRFALQTITGILTASSTNAHAAQAVDEELEPLALEGLVKLAPLHPPEMEEIVLPSLFALLPQGHAPPEQDETAVHSYRLALAALLELCTLPQLFEILLIRVLSRLESLLVPSPPCAFKGSSSGPQEALYTHHLLTTLRVLLEKKIRLGHTDIAKHADRVLGQLYAFLILPALAEDQADKGRVVAYESRIIEDVARIAMLFAQQLGQKEQKDLLTNLKLAFFDGHVRALLGEDATKGRTLTSFKPFEAGVSVVQGNLSLLYSYPVFALRKETFDAGSGIQDLCSVVLSSLPRWSRELRLESSYKLLASLLNKCAEILPDFIERDLPGFWDDFVINSSRPLEERRAALRGYAWAMRGLIIRSDNRAYQAGLTRLVDLFSDATLAKDAARTMAILSREKDGVISKENSAVIRLLYKQRFFSFILPKLVQGYQSASDSANGTPYLIGLSCLLQSMPKQTMVSELPKLLPLLLRALDLPELDLRAHVIDTLALLVKDAPDALKAHASSIVGVLLQNAVCSDPARDSEAGVQLRVAVLRCLAAFPDGIDWLSLHMQKVHVLKTLGVVVDDRKKRVRKEAVDCRARWYLFKAP